MQPCSCYDSSSDSSWDERTVKETIRMLSINYGEELLVACDLSGKLVTFSSPENCLELAQFVSEEFLVLGGFAERM